MDEDEHFKNTTALLMRRERELLLLRSSYEAAVSGLKVAHSLAEFVDRRLPLPELCTKVARALISGLRVQRVVFFASDPGGLLPQVTKGECQIRPLSDAARDLLERESSGLCNEPNEPAATSLAATIGLHRFLWTRIRRAQCSPLLLVAGFDAERAVYQKPFTDAQVAQIAAIGRHLEAIVANAQLLDELEHDKNLLKEFNNTLEQRVTERTLELERALAGLREKEARIDADLQQASRFQLSILPVVPRWPDIEIAVRYRPLDLVGGDIYDVCEIAPHKHRVFVADATGHGIQASLRTIVLKAEYDRLKYEHATPDRLLEALNTRLADAYAPGELLSTGCCFDIERSDSDRLRLLCATAAHPPLLVYAAGAVQPFESAGTFLGVSGATFPLVESMLEPDAVLIAYTDGMSDQQGPGHAAFDLSGALCDAMTAAPSGSLDELMARLLGALDAFRANVPVSDDLTLIVARSPHCG